MPQSGSVAAEPLREPVVVEDDPFDTSEVPAAVVCAQCGRPDCPGCGTYEENTLPSGVIAIVPWERPIGSSWSRLWSTAIAGTRSASTFFGPIARGDLASPLRFALVTEFLAVGSVALVLILGALAVARGELVSVMADPHARNLVLRLVLLGVPAFALLLVFAHAVHGLALDRGARRAGAREHRLQAVRFGLYSAGLDLMTSPLGLIYTLLTAGVRPMLSLLPASIEVPSVSTNALLRRTYHLDDAGVPKARRFATVVISIVGLTAVIVVMVGLFIALLV